MQDGFSFFVFSWDTVKHGDRIYWRDLATNANRPMTRPTVDIRTADVAGTDTTISVGEVYNRILLTSKVESLESVVESPLDDDLLTNRYGRRQKYMTEYSSDGEGKTAIAAFDAMTHGQTPVYDAGVVTDWYLQVKDNVRWTFPDRGSGDLLERYASGGVFQQLLPNVLATQPGAAILALGKVATKLDGKDNAPTAKVDMTNYLVVSVNGNGRDAENETYPNERSLKEGIPCAVYTGALTGGVFSPTDDGTTNYIVVSGRLVLTPLMRLTDTFEAIYNYKPTGGSSVPGASGISQWWHKTVPSRNNGDGRYYTQRWWAARTPYDTPAWDRATVKGLVPFTESGPEEYEFKYSAVGDGSDHISKVGVLACMLIIGDKCVVEKGTAGQVTDFEWRKYKPMAECADEDEYYQQSFTIGFDPKVGDRLVGTKFDLQNNISHELGIDAEGIAIPIRKSDKVSGQVRFLILGPVNTLWDVVTRRHPTAFRHTKWTSTSVPLLAHVDSIMVEDMEVKVYSDNALASATGDGDIVYMSDTKEAYTNAKDDLEMRISSGLTAEECRTLGVADSVKMSTPLDTETGVGVTEVYDHTLGEHGKPEQFYVDAYYREYHAPRVQMKQRLTDTDGGIVGLFNHYRHPTMGKTFFVVGISRDLEEGTAVMNLKEIEQ